METNASASTVTRRPPRTSDHSLTVAWAIILRLLVPTYVASKPQTCRASPRRREVATTGINARSIPGPLIGPTWVILWVGLSIGVVAAASDVRLGLLPAAVLFGWSETGGL